MQSQAARVFVDDWVAGWNTRDLEAVLAHFHDDAVFTSPLAAQLLPASDGVVRGKAALRAYWSEGLRRNLDLRFEIVGIYLGVDTVVVHYRNQRGALVNEVLMFGPDGLVTSGYATYLDAGGEPRG
jgi:ketosteroid isomerase-like protein